MNKRSLRWPESPRVRCYYLEMLGTAVFALTAVLAVSATVELDRTIVVVNW